MLANFFHDILEHPISFNEAVECLRLEVWWIVFFVA